MRDKNPMKPVSALSAEKNTTDVAGSREPKAFTLRPKISADSTMPIHCRHRQITYIHTYNRAYIYTGSFKKFEHLLLWPPRSPDLIPCDFFPMGIR